MKRRNVNGVGWLMMGVLAFSLAGCLKLRYPAEPPPPKYMDMTDKIVPYEVERTDEPVSTFIVDGEPFCFHGTNNYYLNFKSPAMVDDVFDKMVDMNMSVMRFWGYIDRGSLDGSVGFVDHGWPGDGTKAHYYYHYWDPEEKINKFFEGKRGLQSLDYVLHSARQRGIKLIVVLTNNWHEFGGMDQYLLWYGLENHHEFFTHPGPRGAYKRWVHHLVNRVNSIDGTPYKDDPAIFAWELGNELRCMNGSRFDNHEGWDMTTMVTWAEEMSAYIKELDPNHMVAFGDEGFVNGDRSHWAYSGQDGVDHEALCAVNGIDFCTFHLYPDNWGTGVRFGYRWIEEHIDIARRVGKPTILEEFGTQVRRNPADMTEILWGWERREIVYNNWLHAFRKLGGNGAMNWMLAGYDDDLNALYPDYDGYTVYKDFPTGDMIEEHSRLMTEEAPACQLAREYLPPDLPSSRFAGVYRYAKDGGADDASSATEVGSELADVDQASKTTTALPSGLSRNGG